MMETTLVARTCIEDAGKRSGLIDLCSLCNCQFSADADGIPGNIQHGYQQFDPNSVTSKVSEVLKVFLADNDERSLLLQLCPLCMGRLEELIEARQLVSSLIHQITTLLLQNSRFTLIHPKNTITAQLFSSAETESLNNSYLQGSSASVSGLKTELEDISHLDREIEELETQFHLDRLKTGRHSEIVTHSEGDDSDMDSSSSSLYSSLPSLVSFDSSSSAQKEHVGNNIMNVNISALESSASSGNDQTPPKKSNNSQSSPKNLVSSITNLIANTTNDELDVCFSNKIQKMKECTVVEEKSENNTPMFRLPLPPKISPTLTSSSPRKTSATPVKSQNRTKAEKGSLKRFHCGMCPKHGMIKKDLKVHIESHLKICKFVCDICDMAYRHKSGLESHVAIHLGEPKYKCEECQKEFTQKSGLERHIEAIHKNSRNYKCSECGRTFRYHSSFNLHKQSHKETPNKKFKCDEPSCNLSFYTSYHLRRHQKIHTGSKPFTCPVCEKAFSEKYNLESHLKTHPLTDLNVPKAQE